MKKLNELEGKYKNARWDLAYIWLGNDKEKLPGFNYVICCRSVRYLFYKTYVP